MTASSVFSSARGARKPTAERVLDVLVHVTEADELRSEPEARLFESGYLDSLGAVQVLFELSVEFAVSLSPTDIDREIWATPARVVSFMQRRLGE
jgi:D-alanine--poly(phosphoribitol) ligase subunit 2